MASSPPKTHLEARLAFLQEPASYAHAPASVEIIQTHISCVAIAPPYVFKIKKPVNLGFLDFSTLAQRKHYCEAEVALNRRLCADIYEGVVPVSKTAAGLVFGAAGEIVDYAVKMKQLPDAGFLDAKLAAGRLDRRDIDPVIDRLVDFYATTRRSEDIARWGTMEVIRQSTDENFEQVAPFAGDLVPESVVRAIAWYTDRFFQRHEALFARRVAEGHIRDCHGDLRLEHIHQSEDRLCIYDCIEFNERFRYIDVANDVAFLAMDFDHKGRPDYSTYLVEQVAEKLDDPDLRVLAPFYKCYRAFVRAKVAAMKYGEEEVSPADRRRAGTEAWTYFKLALSYTLHKEQPRVIVFMGRIASGKSTQARLLAARTDWEYCASDVIRKKQAGVPLTQRGTEEERKALYAAEQTEKTYGTLLDRACTAVAAGQNIILDATFSSRARRDDFRLALKSAGAACLFLEVTASDETIRARLRQRDEKTDVVSDARLEDFSLINSSYEAPAASEPVVQVASDGELEETALRVLQQLIR